MGCNPTPTPGVLREAALRSYLRECATASSRPALIPKTAIGKGTTSVPLVVLFSQVSRHRTFAWPDPHSTYHRFQLNAYAGDEYPDSADAGA